MTTLEKLLSNFDNRARNNKKDAPKYTFEQQDNPRVIEFRRLASHQGDKKFKISTIKIKQRLVYPLKLQSSRLMIKQAYELEQG